MDPNVFPRNFIGHFTGLWTTPFPVADSYFELYKIHGHAWYKWVIFLNGITYALIPFGEFEFKLKQVYLNPMMGFDVTFYNEYVEVTDGFTKATFCTRFQAYQEGVTGSKIPLAEVAAV